MINPNWIITAISDGKTTLSLVLADLKDGTKYDVYITATNIMAYNDKTLSAKIPDS